MILCSCQVQNHSFECFHSGQEIPIRIKSGGWLHRGTIICPKCNEVCGDEFARQNKTCKLGEEAPPSNVFHKDELTCGAKQWSISILIQLLCTFIPLFKYLSI